MEVFLDFFDFLYFFVVSLSFFPICPTIPPTSLTPYVRPKPTPAEHVWIRA